MASAEKLGLCPEFEKGLDLESRGFDLYVCVRDDASSSIIVVGDRPILTF